MLIRLKELYYILHTCYIYTTLYGESFFLHIKFVYEHAYIKFYMLRGNVSYELIEDIRSIYPTHKMHSLYFCVTKKPSHTLLYLLYR